MSGQGERHEHRLSMKGRQELFVGGVNEVDRFDEASVVLRTSEGELTVEGDELKIGTLDTDKGVVSVSGRINGIFYTSEDTGEKKGLFKRIFG